MIVPSLAAEFIIFIAIPFVSILAAESWGFRKIAEATVITWSSSAILKWQGDFGKKVTVAKAEGTSRISFNKKAVGSGPTTNSSASFEQSKGETKGKAGTEEAENKRNEKEKKLGESIKKKMIR